MINALHLIWIIPLSMLIGISLLIYGCCLAASKDRKGEEENDY